jgi:hypothetical protein
VHHDRRQALLPIHPKARVYGAPIISGHVGADAAACMLAIDIANEDRLVAVMDIGTNTELILGNKHDSSPQSVPRGRRSRAGAISCGMPGLDGAIEDVASTTRRRDSSRRDRRCAAAGHLRLRARRADERAAPHRPMNEYGRFEDGDRESRSTPRTTSSSSRATSTSSRRRRAPTSRACRSCPATTA